MKADSLRLLEKYFDVFLYVANWGTREFYLRLPLELADYKVLRAMLPGEVLKGAAHPHPFYTPIGTFGSDYVLEPVAYGLKFAGSFSGGTLLKTDFSSKLQDTGVNATAYAAKLPGGQTSVIILNKDVAADRQVELDFGRDARGVVQTETLHAPALDSREAHITTSTKTDPLKQGKYSVTVPHAMGVRVTLS